MPASRSARAGCGPAPWPSAATTGSPPTLTAPATRPSAWSETLGTAPLNRVWSFVTSSPAPRPRSRFWASPRTTWPRCWPKSTLRSLIALKAAPGAAGRIVLDRRGQSPLAVLSDAVAAGGPVLAVTADAARRISRAALALRRLCPRLLRRPGTRSGPGRARDAPGRPRSAGRGGPGGPAHRR